MKKDIKCCEKHFESMKQKEEGKEEKKQPKLQAKATGTAKDHPGGPKVLQKKLLGHSIIVLTLLSQIYMYHSLFEKEID